MRKLFFFMLILLFGLGFSQRKSDSILINNVYNFQVDEYDHLYVLKNDQTSLKKYDVKGKEIGNLLMTVPFQIQNVDNPLHLFLFSENAQELKVFDQHFTEIQKIDFRSHFGYIKSAYAEDLQWVWLLDESTKRLIQFDYRTLQSIKTIQFQFDFHEILSMLIYDQKMYIITPQLFSVYNFNGELVWSKKLDHIQKLKRINHQIFIMTSNEIFKYQYPTDFKSVFFDDNAKIVDKNSDTYFVLNKNKGYIYTFKK